MKHNIPMIANARLDQNNVIRWLIGYRGLALIPPLIALFVNASSLNVAVFAFAVLLSAVIWRWHRQLNDLLLRFPLILAADIFVVATLIGLVGGWRSPYYLYALAPLMMAAYFFRLRGVLLATTVVVPLYLIAVIGHANFFASSEPIGWLAVMTYIVGCYLVGTALGLWSGMIAQLEAGGESLEARNRELRVLYDLSAALNRAADPAAVQDVILQVITAELGYAHALVGLYDEASDVIGAWREQVRPEFRELIADEFEALQLSLSIDGDHLISSAVAKREELVQLSARVSRPQALMRTISHFEENHPYLILPLVWGLRPVGVVLIHAFNQHEVEDISILRSTVQQTAAAIGSMATRVRRAKDKAVQDERARIALDLHDTVSQSMFGIVFTLDACLKFLSSRPDAVRPELEKAVHAAESVRREIRRSIYDMWPHEISSDEFSSDLNRYVIDVLHAVDLPVEFDIRGDFAALAPQVRRSLYRICQEGLTNIVHHSAAENARVCLDVFDGRARLLIRDDGRGFVLSQGMAKRDDSEHFGLHGIMERARSLGGVCDIFSRPSAGTSIVIDIPMNPEILEFDSVGGQT